MASLQYSTLTSCSKDNVFRSVTIGGPYRFELRLVWAEGPLLITVGLNPPGGSDMSPSPTLNVLANYARRNRFGGVVLLNLFAWKATQPAHLFAALARGEDVVCLEHNSFTCLKTRLAEHHRREHEDVVAPCWGKHGQRRGQEFLRFLGPEYIANHVRCFGLNRDGSPVHPLHNNLKPLTCFSPE
jgi:hypothetical protein